MVITPTTWCAASAALALIENLQREDLDPIEVAEGCRQLIDKYGLTQESAAKKLGKSRSAVTNSLRLLALPEDVRRMVSEGKLSFGHAKVLLGLPSEDLMRQAAAEVEKLAMDLLHEPESVKVDPVSSTVKKIDQCLYYVDKANKKHLLAKILRDPDVENALVFSRTKHGADRIVRDLKREGIDAVAIHGDKSQNARQAALTAFKTGECKVLVATDIAARGIDIAGLSHVINYDMPMEPEAYVHRIGRTGRAGRDGTAISFCCIDEVKQLGQVEKLIGKRLPLKESEWPMEITTPSEPKPRQPRPAKLTMQGNAAPERKANRPMSAKPAQSAKPAASAPIREVSVEKRAAKSVPREMQVIRREHQQNPVPRFGPASGQRAARSGQPVVIGRDGKMRLGGTPIRVESAPANKPVARTNASSAKKSAGQPVRRVNHSRGRNGER